MEAETQHSNKKLLPARFKVEAQVVNQWSAVAEAGTPFDVIKSDPSFWAHVTRFVRAGDVIHVRADDGQYYARLYVHGVAGNAADVDVLEFHDFSKRSAATDESNDFRVEWAGPHHKFRIVRAKDSAVMQSGFDNKPAALAALAGLVTSKAA